MIKVLLVDDHELVRTGIRRLIEDIKGLEVAGEVLKNKTSGKEFKIVPLPPARQAIIDAGGLIAFTRARLLADKSK